MKRLFVVTGELSGDKHAAGIIKILKERHPDLEVEAVGGKYCENAGAKIFLNHSKMSAMGIGAKIIFDHIMLGKKITEHLKSEFKPDLVLLTDYGGFNLAISKFLKKAGLKIFYYIPPQIWASRKHRIKTVKKHIDKVLTIFPFEKEMYEKEGISAEFVGHPLVNSMPPAANRREVFAKYGFDEGKKLIGIFPGSRKFEINELLKIFVKAAKTIKEEMPETQFALCLAPTIKRETVERELPDFIKLTENSNYELLSTADALMLASGTVALEAALYGTPMIISYKGPWLLYLIYLAVRCIKNVSLPNIISGKDIVPELIQVKAKPEIIAANLVKILKNKQYEENMRFELNNIRKELGRKNSAEAAADAISKELYGSKREEL